MSHPIRETIEDGRPPWRDHIWFTHVTIGDYGAIVRAGDMGEAAEASRRLFECFAHLRRLNGQRQPQNVGSAE
jgi:hypothetical protein